MSWVSLSVTMAKAFDCQGYFGKVSTGKPACSWAQCPVFAKLRQSSPPLSSKAWVAAVIPVPQCLEALPPASWVLSLPLYLQLVTLAWILSLPLPPAPSVIADPSSMGMFQHFSPVDICCGAGCCQLPSFPYPPAPKFPPHPGRVRACRAPGSSPAPCPQLAASWPPPARRLCGSSWT